MRIEYINEPLLYTECSALLTKLFYAEKHTDDNTAAYDPAEYLRGFAQRRQLPFERVKGYADTLSGLYSAFEKQAAAIPEETRQFFFTAAREGTNAVSSTLAIALDKGIRLRDVADEPHRERMRFYLALGTVSDDGYPDHDADYTEETFLKCLEGCGADAGERWNAWSVYRRTDYYLDLLQETLKPFAAIYRKCLPQLQPIFDETILLAKRNLAEDPKAALAQHYFVSLDDVEALVVRPQAALLLGASMWIMDPSLGIENLFVIGCCFDALRSLWFGSENIVNQLQTQVKALDDKRRFQILTALKERPLCGQEICALTGLSPATVSHHMNELVSARFVSIEKVGARINYRQRADVIEEFTENLKRALL